MTAELTETRRPLPAKAQVEELRMLVNEVRTLPRTLRGSVNSYNRDLEAECGYPYDVNVSLIKELMSREGIARRINKLFPQECWKATPALYEQEKPAQTEFEKEWRKLTTYPHFVYQKLRRADERSGVGRFGILVIGINDKRKLWQPARMTVDEALKPAKNGPEAGSVSLTYLNSFDEERVKIDRLDIETDDRSPRYGLPKSYQVLTSDPLGVKGSGTWRKVHWTRVIHLADEPDEGNLFAEPRVKDVYNRILDIRKLLGGSAEMFWKGGFPIIYFGIDPNLASDAIDPAKLKDEVEEVLDGLKRVLLGAGLDAKTLTAQIADPAGHLKVQIEGICAAKGVPYRVFIGSEQGELASSQDVKTWNHRLHDRRENYITPCMILPLAWRLVHLGVLPAPATDEIIVKWPDPNALGTKEKTDIALKLTQAMGEFMTKDVGVVAGVEAFMHHVLGLEVEVVRALIDEIGDVEGVPVEDEEEETPETIEGGTGDRTRATKAEPQ